MYLAPEVLVKELCLSGASISDLMLADIWVLGMVWFSMLNPSLKCPYLVEIREAGVLNLRRNSKPSSVPFFVWENTLLQMKPIKLSVAPCGVL